jgi:hypothetical protein
MAVLSEGIKRRVIFCLALASWCANWGQVRILDLFFSSPAVHGWGGKAARLEINQA